MAGKEKFNLMELLNNKSKETKENIEDTTNAEEGFTVKEIDIDNIEPSSENFYRVRDIESIKQSIELLGIEQNLVVEEIEINKYKLLVGHRRYFASKELVEEGKEQYRYLPCKIKKTQENILNKLTMIMTNSTTRELSDWEKMSQSLEIEELVVELKKQHNIQGRTRDLLSEITNVSPAQLGRYKAINNNLIIELMEEFKNGNIGYMVAYKLSQLFKGTQLKAFRILKAESELTMQDVEKLKTKEDSIKPVEGQISINDIKVHEEKEEEQKEENEVLEADEEAKEEIGKENEESGKEEIENDIEEIAEDEKENGKDEIENEDHEELCLFCEMKTNIETEEGEAFIKLDNGKMVITNKETGEVHYIKINYCPVCSKNI